MLRAPKTYLDELLDVVGIDVCALLVYDKDEPVNAGHVVAPQMWVLPVEIPHLERAALGHAKVEVVEGVGGEAVDDGRQEPAVGGLACALHAHDHDLVAGLRRSHVGWREASELGGPLVAPCALIAKLN